MPAIEIAMDRQEILCYTSSVFSGTTSLWAVLHFTALGGLAIYGLHRLWLLVCWSLERRRAKLTSKPVPELNYYPKVTVQLPLYNERFVARRLIDSAARLNWPKDRLEIQVIDDSTDDTRWIVDERVSHWSGKGANIKVFRRGNREGYKAGALSYCLAHATGEFIAVFDADFILPAEFLRDTIPYFSEHDVGMVQARWGFLNEEYSWLTGVQALLLGAHFSIEHWVRFRRGLFFNFNGTAGVWRRTAIEAAGGWQSDTVTEDLDLSYRAQLAGWRFVYLDDIAVYSELPVTMSAFRSQQQRWAKGSIQTARKILPRLLTSNLPFKVKIEAAAHLLCNFGWLLGAIVTLTLYPTVMVRVGIGLYQLLRLDLPLFFGASGIILSYFLIYAVSYKGRGSVLWLPLLPILSIGLAPSIALSVINGITTRGGVFDRTPKFGVLGRKRLPGLSSIYRIQATPYIILNCFFLSYTLLPVLFAFRKGTWIAIPFFLLFPLGFLLVLLEDICELKRG